MGDGRWTMDVEGRLGIFRGRLGLTDLREREEREEVTRYTPAGWGARWSKDVRRCVVLFLDIKTVPGS
jgi:hypothetical protein